MDEKHWKCDGDSGVGKAMEMCWYERQWKCGGG